MHNTKIVRILLQQSLLGLLLFNNTVFGMEPTDNFEMIAQEAGSKNHFSKKFPKSSPTKKGLRDGKRSKKLDKENKNPNIIEPKPNNNTGNKPSSRKKLFATIGLSKNPATITTEEDADVTMQIISEENVSASEEKAGKDEGAYFLNLPPEMICKIVAEVSRNEGLQGISNFKGVCKTFHQIVQDNFEQKAPFYKMPNEILEKILWHALYENDTLDINTCNNLKNTCKLFELLLKNEIYKASNKSVGSLIASLSDGLCPASVEALIRAAKTDAGIEYFLKVNFNKYPFMSSDLRLLAILKTAKIPKIKNNKYLNKFNNPYESIFAATKTGRQIAEHMHHNPMPLEEQIYMHPNMITSHLAMLTTKNDLNSFVCYLNKDKKLLSKCDLHKDTACQLLLNVMEHMYDKTRSFKELVATLIKIDNLLDTSLEEIRNSEALNTIQKTLCDDIHITFAKAIQALAKHVSEDQNELLKRVEEVRHHLEESLDDLNWDDTPAISSEALDNQLKLLKKLLRNRNAESEEEQLMNDTTISDGSSQD